MELLCAIIYYEHLFYSLYIIFILFCSSSWRDEKHFIMCSALITFLKQEE